MKWHKLIGKFTVVGSILASICLSGCNEASEIEVKGDVYQQYVVLVTPVQKEAYANLRRDNADGERLKLGNGELTVNTLKMYYQEQSHLFPDRYTYSANLDSHHNKAIFKLQIDKKHIYTNEVEFSEIPNVELPDDMLQLHNDKPYSLDLQGASAGDFSAYLVNTLGGIETEIYAASVNLIDGTFVFHNVPTGTYDLYVELRKRIPTKQNVGNAKGEIVLIKQQVLRLVKLN